MFDQDLNSENFDIKQSIFWPLESSLQLDVSTAGRKTNRTSMNLVGVPEKKAQSGSPQSHDSGWDQEALVPSGRPADQQTEEGAHPCCWFTFGRRHLSARFLTAGPACQSWTSLSSAPVCRDAELRTGELQDIFQS